ncbi:Metallophosphoesterase domain-containing protein 1 [Cyphellophora attinorum]|uniref:Metallophosphoesterase domain-containing protein 1 n=1 Tax=Cyphellophora attinorum TaxID=1664694 RepID=A0A0N0NHI5_9EURO|nr:Metallophosphoesterase domain-containing protein 1 [Phialophora attinorum]KPI34309.1 Metallophosphoesterase domain-containing protein 1 [Phialophora attinorum]
MATDIKTRILIISDTHGRCTLKHDLPKEQVDVAIHCGDLTNVSTVREFRNALDLLKQLPAPLKLVILGNHDFSMDGPALQTIIYNRADDVPLSFWNQVYGTPEMIQGLFEDHKTDDNIHLLDEGTYVFNLQNGAQLKVYASQYTPAWGGDWGFQYHPDKAYNFAIEPNTDIAITHGPPRGILDMSNRGERAGCPHLFTAVAKVKPKIHCFGHIHEAGAPDSCTGGLEAAPPIDNAKSRSMTRTKDLRLSADDFEEASAEEQVRLQDLVKQEHAFMSLCKDSATHLVPDQHTLFVNAAIEPAPGEHFPQSPWIVEVDLPSSRDK